MELKFVVILLCIALITFLFYAEIKRPNKKRLVWRLLASVLAVIAFALLIIPVSYHTKTTVKSGEITLITAGTSTDSLKKYVGKQLYTTDRAVLEQFPSYKIKHIPDLAYFLHSQKQVGKLNIRGYGLSETTLKQFGTSNLAISFYPALPPNGIIACSWGHQLKATEKLLLQGIYNNTSSKPIKLVLQGLGSRFDSVNIKANSRVNFSFENRPPQSGKAIYELIAFDDLDTVNVEKVPFEVTADEPMRILMLASFPDFEYRFLKDWLYANQYPLIFRSRISKDKYSTSFLNTKTISLNRINKQVLDHADILIIDQAELASLSSAESSVITSQIKEGMGLLVRISGTKPIPPILKKFNLYAPASVKPKNFMLRFFDGDTGFKPLKIELPVFIKPGNGEQPIVFDQADRVLVNSQLNGTGKIAVSAIPATYLWKLAGDDKGYGLFWSGVLNKIGRKKTVPYTWEISPVFPLKSTRTDAVFESALSDATLVVKMNQISLAPIQNIQFPFRWKSTFWPQQSGWNKLAVNKNSTYNFYVYQKNDWKNASDQGKIRATSRFADKSSRSRQQQISVTEKKEVSKWWFFALFLLSSAFLWYESRRS